MAKPKLVLHIGHSKCGSTAIQRYLLSNQHKLAAQGCYLFGADLRVGKEGPVKGVPNAIIDDKTNWDAAAEHVRDAAALAGPGERFVLTAEALGQPRQAEFVSKFIHAYDVKLIHYIRRQDDWCYSAWKQWQLKRGVRLHDWVDRCVDKLLPSYAKTFQSYRDIGIGVEEYRLKVLDSVFLGAWGLLGDFCSDAEIDATGFNPIPGYLNPNFDRALLDVFRASPFLFEDQHDNRPFNWVQERVSDEALSRRGGLTLGQSHRIMDAHCEDNELLCSTFFADRSEEFWRAFSAPDADGRASFANADPKQQRLAELEDEVEDLRRALGYLIGVMIDQDGNLPDEARRRELVRLWRGARGVSEDDV
ncbi:hypothetical protein [Marinicauda salina]|uniref:hypothetical protein n=1 Tax=Marinicauda salina TaxID=2135793 RepID=UPI0011B260B8|nr:hypothetical protein [Marinicauda salina]